MKIKFTAILLLGVFSLFSQETIENSAPKKLETSNFATRASGDTLSAWVNYGRLIYELQAARSYFRNYLYPDTNVVLSFSGGYGNVWKHSFGQVLDPNARWFSNFGTKLDDTTQYRLDSVGINYRYFRWNDNVPDTLVIQFFNNSRIRNRTTTWQSGASYANVEYNYLNKKGANPIKEVVYILENKDTANAANQKTLKIPVDMPFDTGLVAATVTYFPGVPAQLGDTIDAYNSPLPSKKVNAFLVYEFRDEVPYVDASEYNNGMSVTSSVRFNQNTNGWNGRYQPGTSWASSSGIYHFDLDFHITYDKPLEPKKPEDPSSMNELVSRQLNVFPNPAKDWFSIKSTSKNLNIKLINSLGKVVWNQESISTSQKVNTSELPSGIYILNVTNSTNNEVYRQRLIIEK